MKLVNTTDYPDYFLRRMVSWCCKQIGYPVRSVKEAKFRNKTGSFSGHAYGSRRIVVSVSKTDEPFPVTCRKHIAGEPLTFNDRNEALVSAARTGLVA